LPLAHMFERALFYVITCQGGGIGFFSGDILKIMDDIKELKPTVFISVPRLYSRIYDKVLMGVKEKNAMSRWMFNNGLETKLTRRNSSGSVNHWMYDKVVFNKLKNMMGGSLRFMITGGAPLPPDTQAALSVMFATPLLSGYGLTETMAASFVSRPNDPESGHIGGVVASLEFKLVSQPELEYDVTKNPPRGELHIRGPAVFHGYFQNPEETAAALDADGWMHTGDIAELRPDGGVKIIDRKKNIFKLSQGEYVAPEKIEGVYQQVDLIAQVFVTGYSTESCLVAIVVPDEAVGKKWMANKGTKSKGEVTLGDICASPDFKTAILSEMEKSGKESELKGFEKVKDVYLCPEPFSEQNGLLTPTSKLKRKQALEKYKTEVDAMYRVIAAAPKSGL